MSDLVAILLVCGFEIASFYELEYSPCMAQEQLLSIIELGC
ncbi:MAG: hypothetical protein R2849_13670 [Thermomicrobiales bacterium]